MCRTLETQPGHVATTRGAKNLIGEADSQKLASQSDNFRQCHVLGREREGGQATARSAGLPEEGGGGGKEAEAPAARKLRWGSYLAGGGNSRGSHSNRGRLSQTQPGRLRKSARRVRPGSQHRWGNIRVLCTKRGCKEAECREGKAEAWISKIWKSVEAAFEAGAKALRLAHS